MTSAPPAWSLVQYRDAAGAIRVGLRAGDGVFAAPSALDGLSMMALLARWPELSAALRDWRPDDRVRLEPAAAGQLLAPLTYPGKILCCGANYYDHVVEMGIEPPDGEVTPFFFLKPPTTTIIGTGEPIRIPDGVNLDWEAELGIVIADRCRDLDPADARDHIAGYVVANDVSARNRLMRRDALAAPFAFDWVAAKTLDGSCPIGPDLVPAWLVADPQNLEIRLRVNGTLKQQASTAGMITPIDDIVAAASRLMTLEPGDVILTGTPAGVGHPRRTYLAPGDEIVIEIDGVGRLANPVVAA